MIHTMRISFVSSYDGKNVTCIIHKYLKCRIDGERVVGSTAPVPTLPHLPCRGTPYRLPVTHHCSDDISWSMVIRFVSGVCRC